MQWKSDFHELLWIVKRCKSCLFQLTGVLCKKVIYLCFLVSVKLSIRQSWNKSLGDFHKFIEAYLLENNNFQFLVCWWLKTDFYYVGLFLWFFWKIRWGTLCCVSQCFLVLWERELEFTTLCFSGKNHNICVWITWLSWFVFTFPLRWCVYFSWRFRGVKIWS